MNAPPGQPARGVRTPRAPRPAHGVRGEPRGTGQAAASRDEDGVAPPAGPAVTAPGRRNGRRPAGDTTVGPPGRVGRRDPQGCPRGRPPCPAGPARTGLSDGDSCPGGTPDSARSGKAGVPPGRRPPAPPGRHDAARGPGGDADARLPARRTAVPPDSGNGELPDSRRKSGARPGPPLKDTGRGDGTPSRRGRTTRERAPGPPSGTPVTAAGGPRRRPAHRWALDVGGDTFWGSARTWSVQV